MRVKSLFKHFQDDMKAELLSSYYLYGVEWEGKVKDLKNEGKNTYAYSNVINWNVENNKLIVKIS